MNQSKLQYGQSYTDGVAERYLIRQIGGSDGPNRLIEYEENGRVLHCTAGEFADWAKHETKSK